VIAQFHRKGLIMKLTPDLVGQKTPTGMSFNHGTGLFVTISQFLQTAPNQSHGMVLPKTSQVLPTALFLSPVGIDSQRVLVKEKIGIIMYRIQ